tara:strand:+ start:2782 stop:3963 length:1182 start_codon:yes stop_codon:yes gene_type:complete
MINYSKIFNSKNILFILIFTVSISQLVKFYSFYIEYSEWQYSDWLINYQGGFIRRGLVGEILFKIYRIFNIDLDILVLITVFSLILFISFLLVKTINHINNNLDILIFLSPGFFLYPLMNSEVVGRKDILMISAIGFFCFFGNRIKKNFLLITLIFFLILTSLSHTGFLFYSPYLIFIYYLIMKKKKIHISFFKKIILSITLIFMFSLILFNQGNQLQVEEICNSIKMYILENCSNQGQMVWLSGNLDNYLFQKINIGYNFYKTSLIYIFSFLAVFFFLGLKIYNSKISSQNKDIFFGRNPLFIFLLLFLFTGPVYIIGLDWGRYIYISYSCCFFITIFCFKEKLLISNYDLKLKKNLFILLVIVYSFTWTFPFYNANNLKLVLKKPINNLLK